MWTRGGEGTLPPTAVGKKASLLRCAGHEANMC